jgi:hypothetical protein
VPELGITSFFTPVFPPFAPEVLGRMKGSGMFAVSVPGKLEKDSRAEACPYEDKEIECPTVFADAEPAERAFLRARPTLWRSVTPAKRRSSRRCTSALGRFTDHGRVVLPAWYRGVLAHAHMGPGYET